jgi:hypothetical protein
VILTKWLLHVTVLLIYQLKLHYSGTSLRFAPLNLIFIYMVVHVWLSTWINHLHTN